MFKLSVAYNDLMEQHPTLKHMVLVARSFDRRLSTQEAVYQGFRKYIETSTPLPEEPHWFEYYRMEQTPPIKEMLQSMVTDKEEVKKMGEALLTYLDRVLMSISAYNAMLTPETGIKFCLGNPISFWLKRFADILDACCVVGMVLAKNLHGNGDEYSLDELPDPLLYIPVILLNYRQLVLVHSSSLRKQMTEHISKDYLELYMPQTLEEINGDPI